MASENATKPLYIDRKMPGKKTAIGRHGRDSLRNFEV